MDRGQCGDNSLEKRDHAHGGRLTETIGFGDLHHCVFDEVEEAEVDGWAAGFGLDFIRDGIDAAIAEQVGGGKEFWGQFVGQCVLQREGLSTRGDKRVAGVSRSD